MAHGTLLEILKAILWGRFFELRRSKLVGRPAWILPPEMPLAFRREIEVGWTLIFLDLLPAVLRHINEIICDGVCNVSSTVANFCK